MKTTIKLGRVNVAGGDWPHYINKQDIAIETHTHWSSRSYIAQSMPAVSYVEVIKLYHISMNNQDNRLTELSHKILMCRVSVYLYILKCMCMS